MKKNVLLRTNLLVCLVIILGFITTAFISYQSNQGMLRKDVESVTALTSEGIYHQIDSVFIKPVNISLTMANDSLLKNFLNNEVQRLDDKSFTEDMRAYLNAYREKYGYDAVFLASAQTKRYFNFNGLDRALPQDDPENEWFYKFLKSGEECSLNIDNDEVEGANNEISVFVNCRIKDNAGKTIGIVGVGFRVDHLQEMFKSYEDKFGVDVCLIDGEGTVQISTEQTGYEAVNLFDLCNYPDLREQILGNRAATKTFWHSSQKGSGYLVSAYIENLGWHLIVENDTTAMDQELAAQFIQGLLIIAVIIVLVLIIISYVIHKYNAQIIKLTVVSQREHLSAFQRATEQLYENIYEVDVTHNRAASEATESYFESLGAPKRTPYDKALLIIAEKQIKEEFRQGYIDTFSPESVLNAYKNGVENLRYDFMITTDGGINYYWMRITTQLFHWDEDDSVRMLVYRQNIDEEKQREMYLYAQMQKDSLTGLLNKAATQEQIRNMLQKEPGGVFAFFILDVDNFKCINDRIGHAMGDSVLVEFAKKIKSQFDNGDVIGRIGGDEFVVFIPVDDSQAARQKAQELVSSLRQKITVEAGSCEVTTSIGVAVAPLAGSDFETLYKNADTALYQTKRKGKDGYTVYHGE